ncbi:MAG: TonB-dependent receptor, partial [Candidatus Omnitrophica bacterium]|nr:TonB-dependent receptor [Candidatus Omnitrophota bacterium]
MRKSLLRILFGYLFLTAQFIPLRAEVVKKDYSIDLGKIVITSSKLEQMYKYSTQNISVVDSGTIESSGIIHIGEILDLLPSVDILEQGSIGANQSIYTRGASSSQVLTLIDGRPINTHRDGVADFNQISLTNIERIEVLKGPASNIYGTSAVGGVVNIITKTPDKKMITEVTSRYGSFATNLESFYHGSKIEDFDYSVSYDYISSHGHRDNSDFLAHNLNTKIGYQINKKNRISVSGGYYNSELGSVGQIPWINLDDRQFMYKKFVDLTYNGALAENQDLLMKFYYNSDRLEFLYSYDPIVKDVHDAKLYGFESQFSQTFFDIFRTAVGFDYKKHTLDSTSTAKHANNVKGVYLETELDVLDVENFFLNNGTLKMGLRWDDYSNFGDRLSPSWSFNIWLFDTFKLHALAAKSFRAPTFNDLYWPVQDYVFYGIRGDGQ